MNEATIKTELLPQGVFVVTLADGKKIRGRFSMYALSRFCDSKDLTYLQAIGKITVGMRIPEYAELLLMALEDYYREDYEQCTVEIKEGEKTVRKRWTAGLVMDLILDPMGLGNAVALGLFKHAVGRLGAIMEPGDENKKKENPVKKK